MPMNSGEGGGSMNLNQGRARVPLGDKPAGKLKRALSRVRPVRSPEKLGYPELLVLSGLRKEGCPICHTVSGSEREYFFRFFYESYREAEVLKELSCSLGFCRSHAYYLTGRGNGRSQLATVHKSLAHRLRTSLLGYPVNRGRTFLAVAGRVQVAAQLVGHGTKPSSGLPFFSQS